jgi:hypothetical protein
MYDPIYEMEYQSSRELSASSSMVSTYGGEAVAWSIA